MKLLNLLPTALLATTVYATDSSSSSSAAADSSPVPEPPTAGEIWAAKWDTASLHPYTQHCKNRNTYHAKIYKLNELYPDLKDVAPQLKVFYNKQLYAGSWGGIDVHGTGRELIQMDMLDVPYKVREWLKREKTQKHFSVQDDVVFFAPGAIYPILPLWVDDADEGLECEGVFDDLENYANEPKDGGVIGKVAHTNTGDKEVKFTVEALQVKTKTAAKDEL
ncbi:uncharacterized protein K460DRAFT_279393 [Cucurbitaria berberidis CBS 394.84]|uniref:Uncharacterized protein n=1 Tax=Cucurbitaria berberidis CBS 394.84 TaxID=1168544 RepID=A0A9P4GKZ2_9PLEO|nr:uncharacterized protein K460DRAFT_279393 [Cucurbitaria berberidis CBS 394.84]KAF1847577.1 hypothetical protein K460DRAFT_279393 [Cucurbitaria berberidis CBS 394.84]